MPEEKEPSGFKVVDRRNFSEDGSPRDATAERRSEQAPAVQPRPPAVTSRVIQPDLADAELAEPDLEEALDDEGEGGGFATLVSYLSTTAMFQLGLLPGPGGERIPADFPNARRTIDLLGVLQQKTQGNLSAEETRMLEEVLYELRVTFVEAEQRHAPKGR